MTTSDLPVVSGLLRRAFDASLTPYLAYAQHGIGALLALQLGHPASFEPKRFYVVAGPGDVPVAFAEFRLPAPGCGFLCYICVDEASRGRGLAGSLIDRFLGDHPAVHAVELDVLDGNATARRLYDRLGFTAVSQELWLRRDLPGPGTEVAVADLSDASAALNTYGFCRLRVKWAGDTVTVGRIGPTVLRCFDARTFADVELLAGLKAAFPELTEAFTTWPDPPESTSVVPSLGTGTSTRITVSHRLRRDVRRASVPS